MLFVAAIVPQELVTEYRIVSKPDATPVTTPDVLIVALALVALQVPPVAPSVKVTGVVEQIPPAPLILPADGKGLTVIAKPAAAEPHALVTV